MVLYAVTFLLSFAALGPLTLIVFQEAAFWFSMFVIILLFEIIGITKSCTSINPFLFLMNAFLTSYIVAEAFSFTFFKFRSSYLKKRDFAFAITEISDEAFAFILVFVLMCIVAIIFLFTPVLVIR